MSKHPIHRVGLSVTLAAMFVLVLAASPVAAGSQIKVTGLLTPDTGGVCIEDPTSLGTYTVTGNLSGCWYIDSWVIRNETPSGSTQASGTELFVGCLNGTRCGRFWTEYTFTYKIVNGVETHGRCHHPIVDGLYGFKGIQGVLQMHDEPSGCATYTGHLSF